MALQIGLTGGIASGKSAVAQRFAAHGAAVIDADQIARELVAPGTSLLARVLERFGPEAARRELGSLTRGDGSLDRTALRRLVFCDPQLLRELEALTHPAIRARAAVLARRTRSPYQIHVNPLLVEKHAQSRYDRVLVVDCPEALQLARLQARDGIDPQLAQAMLAAQASRAVRLAAADDVIVNDGAPEALAAPVAGLDRKYRALAAGGPGS